MTEADKVFSGSIPKFYDTLMVPLIFQAYASDMAQRAVACSRGRWLRIWERRRAMW